MLNFKYKIFLSTLFSGFFITIFLFSANTAKADDTLSIKSLSPDPATTTVGHTVTFTVSVPSSFSAPAFLIYDSFVASVSSTLSPTISNSNINSAGNFSWTPSSQDAGTHTLTIRVVDFSGRTDSINQTIEVTNPTSTALITVTNMNPGQTVNAGQNISFVINKSSSLPVSYYSISDSFGGSVSTVSNSNITSSGLFNWTPVADDQGTHSITIAGVDNTGRIIATTWATIFVHATAEQLNASTPLKTTTVATNYTFNTTLSYGSTGAGVTALQKKLTALGFYKGPITGYFGPLTLASVKKLQAFHKLSTPGVVGPATRAILNKTN